MRNRLWWRILSIVVAGIAAMSMAACMTARNEGGIVGTGNQVDCDAQAKKDGSAASLPEECRREKPQ